MLGKFERQNINIYSYNDEANVTEFYWISKEIYLG